MEELGEKTLHSLELKIDLAIMEPRKGHFYETRKLKLERKSIQQRSHLNDLSKQQRSRLNDSLSLKRYNKSFKRDICCF